MRKFIRFFRKYLYFPLIVVGLSYAIMNGMTVVGFIYGWCLGMEIGRWVFNP